MHMPALLRRLVPLGVLLLTGCAVGPNVRRSAPPADARFAHMPKPDAGAQVLAPGLDIPGDWWTLFRSPALDALVRRAIAANPDLEAARAALRQSQELFKADRGALLPNIELDASSERARNPDVLASPLQSNSNLYTLHTAQLSMAYTLDLFGGTRRQIEASAATAEAQRFQTEAAYLTLTANVVVAAIAEASLRAQIAATRKSIAAESRLLAILRGRLRLGDAARADVAAQETLLAQTEQTLPTLAKQLAQQHDLIAALTGDIPGDDDTAHFDLDALTLPHDLPIGLPAKLVDQRPDIRAAEANLHAAGAQVGVAIAARLPTITLTGSVGGSSTNFATLLSPDNVLWSIVGGLTQPLFEGGALLHRQRAAEAGFDQAKAQYRSAVIAGFQNVSDALAAITSDTDALTIAERADRAAADSLAIAQGETRLGAVAAVQELSAEQARRQADIALQQARVALFSDTAALFQALGGGWWNRGAMPGPAPEPIASNR